MVRRLDGPAAVLLRPALAGVVLIAVIGCPRPSPQPRTAPPSADTGALPASPDAGVDATADDGACDPNLYPCAAYEPVMPPTTPYLSGSLRACQSRDLGAPRPAELRGCTAAHCLRDRGLAICRCDDDRSEPPVSWIRVSRGDRVFAQLDLETELDYTESRVAPAADLDGDSREEILVGGRTIFLNGAGVDFWQVAVVDGLEGASPRLTRFGSASFGPAAFAWSDADSKCAILVTDFHEAAFQDYRLYTRPSYFDSAGALRPAASLPMLAADFGGVQLVRFGEEGDQPEPRTGPLAWFDAPGTLVMAEDPGAMGRVQSSRQVAIGEVSAAGATARPVVLRLDGSGGAQQRVQLYDPDSQPDEPQSVALGHGPSRRLFPFGYRPADPRAALTGRRGRLEALDSFQGYTSNILWLD
jgi:hypothetical protein